MVIGDSVDDVLMASSARMRAVGVTFGVDHGDQLVAAGAGWLAGSAAELRALLQFQRQSRRTGEHIARCRRCRGWSVRSVSPGPHL